MKRTRSVTVPTDEEPKHNTIHLEKDENGEQNYTFSMGFLHREVKYQSVVKLNIQGWTDEADGVTFETPHKEITVQSVKKEVDEVGRGFCVVVADICVLEEGLVTYGVKLTAKDGSKKILHFKMQILGDTQGHPALRHGVTRIELPHPPAHPDLSHGSEDC
eukprot:TRINITY_DN649_c0_g2_i1.p1 TRINITY_DN649_c0_g2~~TRINITY_DN649_c0_g2_i1.p1  ORF type:complete len:186 (+),score=41.86 TRINITY_DN649_c0_g2_i1:76-558(+)